MYKITVIVVRGIDCFLLALLLLTGPLSVPKMTLIDYGAVVE
jgi:hypothetical protein